MKPQRLVWLARRAGRLGNCLEADLTQQAVHRIAPSAARQLAAEPERAEEDTHARPQQSAPVDSGHEEQNERLERERERTQLKDAIRRVEAARRAQATPLSTRARSALKQAVSATRSTTNASRRFLLSLLRMDAREWRDGIARGWRHFVKEMKHYWAGTKLLATEVRIAGRHTLKLLEEGQLTRRERKQLTRTVADVFRVVPFMAFVIIPFMEVFLPFALKLFPNMLPSTFQDNKLKKEEDKKRRVQAKLELARFMQDTYAVMARESKHDAEQHGQTERGERLSEFIAAVRRGDKISNKDIVSFAKLFNDELTLDNCDRVQLTTMCKFLGVKPYGTDAFLRYQVRRRLRQIKKDDRMIVLEGVETLSESELQSACKARGMRWEGESVESMQAQLRDWLDLSLNHSLPSSLLILSRAFLLTHGKNERHSEATLEDLQSTLASLPDELVTDIENESGQITHDAKGRRSRLEYLRHQEELIEEEREGDESNEGQKQQHQQHEQHEQHQQQQQQQQQAQEAKNEVGSRTATEEDEGDIGKEMSVEGRRDERLTDESDMGKEDSSATREVLPLDQMSEESEVERLERASASRKKLLRQLSNSLTTLSSAQSVSEERSQLSSLLKKELDRYEGILDSTSKEEEKETVRTSSQSAVAEAMSSRVDRMLSRLSKEIDTVESSTSPQSKPLDRDRDGCITADELEQAKSFLRDKLQSEDMKQLLQEAGVLNSDGSIRVQDLHRVAAQGRDEDDD